MESNRKHRIRDLILYIAISLAIIGLVFAPALSGVKEDAFKKWAFFWFFTLCAFGFFVEQSRALWRRTLFWTFLGCALLLHCSIFWAISTHIKHPNSDWFAAAFLETLLLYNVAKWLMPPTPTPQ